MKITIITKHSGLTILGSITKSQLLSLFEKKLDNQPRPIQTLTSEMLEKIKLLPTFDAAFTRQCKDDLIKMLEKIGVGANFFVSADWVAISATKAKYVQNLLTNLEAGQDYEEARQQALNDCAEMGRKEIQDEINSTFCTKQTINIRQPYQPTQHPMNASANLETTPLEVLNA
ncbi:MAG: hypothetical protein HY817_01430 [Candidatus Abawacabacteria bacterium]|nr:hypothetical protein [Candidatus Abawacabacteria bacterium]